MAISGWAIRIGAFSGRLPFFVYILENQSGRFYIGQSKQLDRRIEQHNDSDHSKVKYTTKHSGPWHLIWSEEHPDRSSAIASRTFKQSAGRAFSSFRDKLFGYYAYPSIA